jgi:hypothetical protein
MAAIIGWLSSVGVAASAGTYLAQPRSVIRTLFGSPYDATILRR